MNAHRFVYFAYGLRLISDKAIPNLAPFEVSDPSVPDLHIRFESKDCARARDASGETLWFESEFTDDGGKPALEIWKGHDSGDFFIRYGQGLTFRVNLMSPRIEVLCQPRRSQTEIALYLLGPVLGIVLRLRGLTCLHASAVVIDGGAVAFTGEMGAGKSTMAAIFAKHGHAVVTDDILPLENDGANLTVHSGYPYINLLPDSFALFCDRTERQCPAEPVLEKMKLALGRHRRFQDTPVPLALIYVLAHRSRMSFAVTADSMAPQESLIALASNTYANKMLDTAMRASEFCTLGQLVRSVPVRKLVAPARSLDVRSLYRAVRDDANVAMKKRAG